MIDMKQLQLGVWSSIASYFFRRCKRVDEIGLFYIEHPVKGGVDKSELGVRWSILSEIPSLCPARGCEALESLT